MNLQSILEKKKVILMEKKGGWSKLLRAVDDGNSSSDAPAVVVHRLHPILKVTHFLFKQYIYLVVVGEKKRE